MLIKYRQTVVQGLLSSIATRLTHRRRDKKARQLMSRLISTSPFDGLPHDCGNDKAPGIDDPPEWQSWTEKRTTSGQVRIEDQLENLLQPTSSILHVGAGNSGFGRRFAARVGRIVALTIHDEERVFGEQLGIENYQVIMANKFSREADAISGYFDFIVDPNPSTYVCCVFHFARMMVTYADLLKRDGGLLLTEQRGLGWVSMTNNPNWSLAWEDWSRLGEHLRMPARRLTDVVYAIEAPPRFSEVPNNR
jgi:hypothetical protein